MRRNNEERMIVEEKDGVCVLRVGGKVEPFTGELTLERIKKAIGCEVAEFCDANPTGLLIIDDSGKLTGKEFNSRATRFYKYALTRNGVLADFIVGDALLMPKRVQEAWYAEDSE